MIFDIVVLAALLISCLTALMRGFIREVLTILGVVGGTVAALLLGPALAPVVRGWFGVGGGNGTEAGAEPGQLLGLVPYSVVADVLAYGAVFIVVVAVLSFVSHALSGGARKLGLGALDRSLGVVFGVVRALVLVALLYMPVYLFTTKDMRDQWFAGSHTRVYVEAASSWMTRFMPAMANDKIQARAEDIAGSMSQSTREKLQEMDVLRKANDLLTKGGGPGADLAPRLDGPGYDMDQREDIRDLIIENEE